MNPYLFDEDGRKRAIHFSGGRSSAYMLHHILAAYQGALPADVSVIFCNTGKEREETLAFIDRCEREWGIEVIWLEYDFIPGAKGGRIDPKHVARRVVFETASRMGQPFEKLIESSSILPNVAMRKCTTELKVRTAERWLLRELGWKRKQVIDILGIRYDEPRRWKKALMEECRTEYPMVHARTTKRDVDDFWAGHRFDLGIDSRQGNCDLCFLKGKRNLLRTIRDEPERTAWWIEQENRVLKTHGLRSRNSDMAQFSQRYSYSELLEESQAGSAQLVLIDEPDDEAISCFCGE